MKWSSSVFIEQVKVAVRSILGQALRTSLTVGIIGIGIMALIAMVTATESLKENVRQEFSSLGTNTFSINPIRTGGFQQGRRNMPVDPISFEQAKVFAKELQSSEITVSYSINATMVGVVSKGTKRTNPNVKILGVDQHYLNVSNINIEKGRGFSQTEVEEGDLVILVGLKIVSKLYEEWEDPLGSNILIGGAKYKVIGVLESRGASFGMSQDNQCLIPIPAARRQFSDKYQSYTIVCEVPDPENLDSYIDVVTGAFRMVRGDLPGSGNSFEISQSNALVDTMLDGTKGITIAAVVIGIITL